MCKIHQFLFVIVALFVQAVLIGCNLNGVGDTTAPSVVALDSSLDSLVHSNKSELIISGRCELGAVVKIVGDVPEPMSAVCENTKFSFKIKKIVDGNYAFAITQVDKEGNSSQNVSVKWDRDTKDPAVPVITTPVSNPFFTGDIIVVLGGTCESGATVLLKEKGELDSVLCEQGQFEFIISELVDGNYASELYQKDLAGNSSGSIAFSVMRDSLYDIIPQVTFPTFQPHYTNINIEEIRGICANGTTIHIDGMIENFEVVSPAGVTSQLCINSSFSFIIQKFGDGAHVFNLSAVNSEGHVSPAFSQQWILDRSPPAAPVIEFPKAMPYISGDSVVSISGVCEQNDTVILGNYDVLGDMDFQPCVNGKFNFSVSRGVNGVYSFYLRQVDYATNLSDFVDWTWIRDTAKPESPIITQPSAKHYYSNSTDLTIAGTCTVNDQVILDTTGQSVLCVDGTFSFNVSQVDDGTIVYAVSQTDPNSELVSSQALVSWTLDRVPPQPLGIRTPTTDPFISSGSLLVIGTCEDGSTVVSNEIGGPDSQAIPCVNSEFRMILNRSVDGVYQGSMGQIDQAQNASIMFTGTWIRDSSLPAAPTIIMPWQSPLYSNERKFVISGACVSDYQVKLQGDLTSQDVTDPAGELVQICKSSQYNFEIQKTVDGTYNFNIYQVGLNGLESSSVGVKWVRDTVSPTTMLSSTPDNPNFVNSATFVFTSDDPNARYECSINGFYSGCISPVTFSLVSDTHTFAVRAIDQANNVDPNPATYTWVDSQYAAIGLFHFDNSMEMGNGTMFLGTSSDDLIDHGSATAVGKFAEGRSFVRSEEEYLSTHDSETHATALRIMTIEAQVKPLSLPSSGEQMAIASKMGASNQMGWEFGIANITGKNRLYFKGSLNGTSFTLVNSGEISLDVNVFSHVAATWNLGAVRFFQDGVDVGGGYIGAAGVSKLWNSTADFRIGSGDGINFLDAVIDEVRWSGVNRWIMPFENPVSAYLAD